MDRKQARAFEGLCRRVMQNVVIDLARARQRRPPELFASYGAQHDIGDPRAAEGRPGHAAWVSPRGQTLQLQILSRAIVS